MHPSSTGTQAPVLGTILGSYVSLRVALHQYPSSCPLLHNKLATLKYFPEFCELF